MLCYIIPYHTVLYHVVLCCLILRDFILNCSCDIQYIYRLLLTNTCGQQARLRCVRRKVSSLQTGLFRAWGVLRTSSVAYGICNVVHRWKLWDVLNFSPIVDSSWNVPIFLRVRYIQSRVALCLGLLFCLVLQNSVSAASPLHPDGAEHSSALRQQNEHWNCNKGHLLSSKWFLNQ